MVASFVRFLFGHRVERRLSSVLTGALEMGSDDLPGTPALATWLFLAACLIAMFPHLPASLVRRPRTALLAVGAWIVFWLAWPAFLHLLSAIAPLTQTTQCVLVIPASITALVVSLNHTGDVSVLQHLRNGMDSLMTLDACNLNSSNGYGAWPAENEFNGAPGSPWPYQRRPSPRHINRSSSNSNCDNYRSRPAPRKSRVVQITARNRPASVKPNRGSSPNKRTKACQGKNSSDRQRSCSPRPNQRQPSPAPRRNKASESQFTWLSQQQRPQKGRSPERVGTKRKLTPHGPGKQPPRQKPPAKRPRVDVFASKKKRHGEPQKQIPAKTARLGGNGNMSKAAKHVYARRIPYAAARLPNAESTPYAANAQDAASTPNAASTSDTPNNRYVGSTLRDSTPTCSLQTVTSPLAEATRAHRSQATSKDPPLSPIVRMRDETTTTLADAEPPPRKRPKLDSNDDGDDHIEATSTGTAQPARRRRQDRPDDQQTRNKKTPVKHKDQCSNTSVDQRNQPKSTCDRPPSPAPPPYTPRQQPPMQHAQTSPYLTPTYIPYPQPYYFNSQQSGRTTFPSSYMYSHSA